MAGTAFLNVAGIMARVNAALASAIEESAERVAVSAKRRAPIRKVFREKPGFRRKVRALTQDERDLAISRAQSYYTTVKPDEFKRTRAVAHIRNYAQAYVPTRGSANAPGASSKLRRLGYYEGGTWHSQSGSRPINRRGGIEPGPALAAQMTSRGRYEVREGRATTTRSGAIHQEASGSRTNVQAGGALKASISADPVVETGNGVKSGVTAAIKYAKFVEFPTIRTRAQPFLLPALHDERARLPKEVADAVKSALGG